MKALPLLFTLGTVCFMCTFSAFGHPDDTQTTEDQKNTDDYEVIIVRGTALELLGGIAATPRKFLTGDEFVHRRQGGLGETLAGIPGVHLDNFGGGASRPVIRGQTLPRIEILSNDSNLFDVSSVSPDHAITADPLLLDGIEILRGPAAATYGGNALNGVINLIDSKIPTSVPDKGVSGAVELRYGTGDNEASAVGRVTAGTGSFAIHLEGMSSDRDDYEVPETFGTDTLKDSFADNSSYSVGASWIVDNGYVGVAYTKQASDYGLPGHSHENADCHTHGLDLHCASHDVFIDPFLASDDDHIAQISLNNERIDLRADYDDLLSGFSHLRLRLSYTDYSHDELDGDILFSGYTNEVYNGRLELTHVPLFGLTGTFGVEYTDATFTGLNLNSSHKENTPQEFVSENIGVFFSEQWSLGALEFEFSARKDWRTVDATYKEFSAFIADLYGFSADQLAFYLAKFPTYFAHIEANYPALFYQTYPSSKHNPFSIALGSIWDMGDGYSTALSLARSQRAPSVRELYAMGNNLATNSYEVGVATGPAVSEDFAPSLVDVEETVKSIDLTFRQQGDATEFEVGLFYQDINNYLFAELIEQEDSHRYLHYRMADTRFFGIDGQVSHQINNSILITLFGDYVRADFDDEDELPRIPPGRLGTRINWEAEHLSADIEYYQTFSQNRVASYETKTDGYGILNATISYQLNLDDDRSVELYARGTNLTNKLAFIHTSFVKDQSPLRGRNFTLGARMTF